MKLIHAEFTNFRLLRDLILDFNTKTDKKLTVIRAENESGKTTILNGLQWGLYGDGALPGRRRDYRLHPIDWDMSEGSRVPITVEIDFETKATRHSRTHGLIEVIRTYRIIRSTYDTVRGDEWEPGPTTVSLFEITHTGSEPIEPPESRIKEELPEELREIFFTDGDRALSFIEADVAASTKQTRVKQAIESLLGLDVINDALGRVKRTAAEVNKRVRNMVSDHQLSNVSERISELAEEEPKLELHIQDAEQQFASFDEKHADVEKKIEETLSRGNRDDLNKQIAEVQGEIKRIDIQQADSCANHARLLFDLNLSRELMAPAIESSIAKLNDLRDQGKIPNSTIPVLEELLTADACFCGETLHGHENDAQRRKENIRGRIEGSRKADTLQSAVTDLYYASRPLQANGGSFDQTWQSQYSRIAKTRDELETRRNQFGQREKSLEVRLEQIPDTDLQGIRRTRTNYRHHRDRFNTLRVRYESDLRTVKHQKAELEATRDRLLRQQTRGMRIMADLEVAQDIQTVLSNAYQRLATEELAKVSSRMNDIFLEMIGADPSQGAIIQSAEITKQFEIIVYGPDRRLLNPDRDLNGASRRALTLAFILALTRVSEVEAPNVIDTPLGMMSGHVKRSALATAIRESSQIILFLTRSEIAGCEDILDIETARVITLTNPAHYPTMLVNDLGVQERTILKCDCNHRRECSLCQRRADPAVEPSLAI